jgi:hypothetical protein
MHETGKKLFNLMFRSGETVCVSHNKYGYHSIPLDKALNGPVTLVPPDERFPYEYPTSDELILAALNPIKGFRQDANCTAFRNFLVEMDYGSNEAQMSYVKRVDLPYSAAVFSGNKSLHFLISLDTDLPSEKVYRLFSEWILNIVTLADQATKNPSRSIRIPGALRDTGKHQELVDYRGAIKIGDLVSWLKLHPDAKPKEKVERKISDAPNIENMKGWVLNLLKSGIGPPNRNRKWFTVAVEFALSGYSEEYTIETLGAYFSPDRDFKEREWETTIRSAFKWSYERKGQ